MVLLIGGVVLWSATHLLPAALFSLDILIALLLIIFGWQAVTPSAVYVPPLAAGPIPAVLIFIGLTLFAASATANNMKRFVRHPQMTGVLCWGLAHLLCNGSNRAVVLFGGLSLWALLEIILINRRDGEFSRPAAVSPVSDLKTLLIGATLFVAFYLLHAKLFGVPVSF